MLVRSIAVLALCLPPGLASAQAVLDCGGWQGQARNIVEPWEDHTRTFANGQIRVALLDTVEPAAGAFYLMVLAPPYDELGSRSCALIGAETDLGFAQADFSALGASYDPVAGLTLRMGVEIFAPLVGGFDPAILAVTINQAAGTVTPVYEIP